MEQHITQRPGQADDGHDTGASSVEYGLIISFVAAVMMFILFILGPEIVELFASACFYTEC